ncbi:MAG: hypothetical protein FWB72_07525 [Firmicutes bacterium]|nr:hypothetical protein [Bacillota bacterium]
MNLGYALILITIILILFLSLNLVSGYAIYKDFVRKDKQFKKDKFKFKWYDLFRIQLYKFVSGVYFYINFVFTLLSFITIVIIILDVAEFTPFILVQIVGSIWFLFLVILAFVATKYTKVRD